MNPSQAPRLSVIVVPVGDTIVPYRDVAELAGNLEALSRQIDPPPMEVIVPFHDRICGLEELARRFPNVHFLRADGLKGLTSAGGSREHHDELRSRGAAAARGEIIAFLEDHVRPDPLWAAAVMQAHGQDYAVIGGAIQNGVNRALNWATYFCDLGKYQNPVPAGESAFASTVNNSYKGSILEQIRPIWSERFNETAVNWAIRSNGGKLALSPNVVVYQHRLNLRLGTALREFFIWGRSYARTRAGLISNDRRLFYLVFAPALPTLLLTRMTVNVFRKRSSVGAFLRSLPLSALLVASWSCGEMAGYLGGSRQRLRPARSQHASAG